MYRRFSAQTAPQRARALLLITFALSGVMIFSWLARLPSIREGLGLSDAALAQILLVGSVGALATVFASSALINRFGSARLFGTGAVVMSLGFILIGLSPTLVSAWLLCLGVIINGIGGALLNVSMNVESARVEQAYQRAIIPHFHAAFSAGAAAGSLLGAACAGLNITVVAQFSVVAIVVAALRLLALAGGTILPGGTSPSEPTQRPAKAMRVWGERRTLLIGLVALAAAVSEGAVNNWLSLAFVDGFGTSEAFGGIALGVFIGSMTVVRVVGTRAIDRLGRVTSLRLSALFGLVGLLLFAVAALPVVALVGVIGWGIGAALCFPIAVAAVSGDASRAAGRVSVMASMGSLGTLTAAPAIGMAATSLGGIQHALLVAGVGMLITLAVSGEVANVEPAIEPLAAEPAVA